VREILLGFMGRPIELVLVIVGLMVLLFIVLAVYIYGNKKRLRDRMDQSRNRYDTTLRKLSLSPVERDLLEELHLYQPDQKAKQHLLVSNPSVFNLCADRMMREKDVEETTIAALRLKLGFKETKAEKRIVSTATLPASIYLLIVQRETKKFYTKITDNSPGGLRVEITDKKIVPPGVGTMLTCYFRTRRGTFHFQSDVLALERSTLRLSHSEHIQRSQRRKFYRIKLKMGTLVRLAGSEEIPTPSYMSDLSGGGATANNPDRRFKIGDDVQIMFEIPGDQKYSIIGEVLRLSDERETMHIAFGPINESTRDRLISFVLNQKKKKMN
jgi:c-di-GMP-binding flagellar brake protein YcgR